MLSNMKQGLPKRASLSLTLDDDTDERIGKWRHIIEWAAKITDVPAAIIGAVIYQESSGDENVNARISQLCGYDAGLMQVSKTTMKEMKQTYPTEFQGKHRNEENVLAGAYYLRQNYKEFRHWGLALRAYNSGPLAVVIIDRHMINPKFPYGDPSYVRKTEAWAVALSTRQFLPNNKDPSAIK